VGNEMNVSDYLIGKGFQWKRRGDTAVLNCPFCQDKEKKFGVSLINGAFSCLHLNSCGLKGSFFDLQTRLGDDPVKLNGDSKYVGPTKKRNYAKPKTVIGPPTNNVIKYLHDRGFTDETIAYFKFGSHNDTAVMIPFYRNGELVNIKYRSIIEKKMWTEKNAEEILFNRDGIHDETLVICEGEYDVAALHQYGIEATSIPMGADNHDKWIESEWDYLDLFKVIYLCFDNDNAGQRAVKNLAVRLGEWRCKLVTLPMKDANDCLKNNVSKSTITSCFSNAVDMKPDTIVSPDYFTDKVQHLFEQGSNLFGIKTPWTKLDSILKGWRDSELTVWSGRNGSGKSTILNQVFIDLGTKGVKSCIYSGEMPPERYLRWAIIQYLENDKPNRYEIDEALRWMSEKIYILNLTQGIEPDKLISDFEYTAKRYGVKHFFIDSLMKITFEDHDEYKQQKEFVSRLCGFSQKYGVHVHLVAHPRKTEKDDDITGKVDIMGSGHITNLCHNVIVLYRTSEEKKESIAKKGNVPADMRMFIKKNREFGIEGSINMKFNEETKRFTD
jgi:twinkle protein